MENSKRVTTTLEQTRVTTPIIFTGSRHTFRHIGHEHENEAVNKGVDNAVLGAAAVARARPRNANGKEDNGRGRPKQRNKLDQPLHFDLYNRINTQGYFTGVNELICVCMRRTLIHMVTPVLYGTACMPLLG